MQFQLTDDAKLKFKKAVCLGATYELACDFAALSYSGFKKWIETPEGQAFFEEMEQVKRESMQKALDRIKGAAKSGNKEAQKWLQKHEHFLINELE